MGLKTTTSKKRSKKKSFYLSIINHIGTHQRINDLPQKLSISKQTLNYYISSLKKKNLIKKIGYSVWVLTDEFITQKSEQVKKSSIQSSRPKINLHALNIKFPILKGKIDEKEWEIKEKLRNWIPKYKKIDNLRGLTLKNNNNKSLTIFAKTRNIKNLEEITNLAFKIRIFIYEYFKKQDIILDIFNCQTKNINIATEDKQAESMLKKGERFELDLQKKAEKIFKKDKIDGKAWVDGSPFKFSAETNDMEWKREYLSMPFRIANNTYYLEYMAKNQKSHAKLIKELSILINNLNKLIKQQNL